jgi:hypothetical protein
MKTILNVFATPAPALALSGSRTGDLRRVKVYPQSANAYVGLNVAHSPRIEVPAGAWKDLGEVDISSFFIASSSIDTIEIIID